MLSFGKIFDLGSAAHTCLYDVSEYLRMVDSGLFNRIQSPSHVPLTSTSTRKAPPWAIS